MRKYTTTALSFVFIMTLLASAFMFIPGSSAAEDEMTRASTLYVGSDQTYKTIKAAVNAASSGDTIRIYGGTYKESLTISKSLTLQGNSSMTTIINHTSTATIIWITANYVNINDIGFEGNESLYTVAVRTNGMNTSGGNGIKIENCRFNDVVSVMSFLFSDDNRIMNNTVTDGGFGSIGQTSGNQIINNTGIRGGAIYIEGNNNMISNSSASHFGFNGMGIGLDLFGERNVVKGCHYHDIDGTGIRVHKDNNEFINNRIESNSWNGMYTYVANWLTISGNTFKDNLLNGLRMIGSDNCTIYFNEFINSEEYGVLIEAAAWNAADNEILFNNFIGNGGSNHQAFDYYSTNVWNSILGGNYWSDHSNTDTNNDGYADATYTIDGEGAARDSKPFAKRLQFPNPPKIMNDDVKTAYTGQSYSVQYSALDLDSTSLTWSMSTNASFLTFSPSQVLSGTPNVSNSTYWVNISVSDEQHTASTNFTLTVINLNVAPSIITQNVPICYEDQPYIVDYETDDMDDIVWELITDASFLSLDTSTGVLSGTPSNDEVGFYQISIIVRDEWSQDSTEFTLEVINTNDAPEIETEDILSAYEGKAYSVQYKAEDIDPAGDTLTWSLLTNADFLEMDFSTGLLSGIPGETDAGVYRVNVTVSDGNGGLDSHIFDLEVVMVNNPPLSLSETWRIEIEEDGSDASLNINAMFEDIDGDDLQYSINDHPHISWSIGEYGAITLTPSANWIGIGSLTVTADDGEFTDTSIITIEVSNVNDAPSDPVIIPGSGEFKENETQIVSASAMDIDPGDSLTYEWSVTGIGIIGTGETVELDLPAGTYDLVLKVTDSGGIYSETSMEIVILPVDDMAPHRSDPSSGTDIALYLIGAAIILTITAFILSFYAIRRRSMRKEGNRQGIEAWSHVLSQPDGPTPTKGLASGPGMINNTHRLVPDRGPVTRPQVNGGKLGEEDPIEPEEAAEGSSQHPDHLSELVEDVLSSNGKIPEKNELMARLKKARKNGSIPSNEYKEIEQRLNNIDK